VGVNEGDFRGADNRALQAAVDYVAGLGGGTVRIGPGRYQMRNALMLRDHVRIVGVPGKTILAACDGVTSRLAVDGDCNERQVTLADPGGFRVGDGVQVRDDHYGGGFEVTTATLTARLDEHTFRISAPLYLDYLVSKKATVALAFPVVGGWGVRDARVEGLTIDGNRAHTVALNGCRGGGIFLFECDTIGLHNCMVHDYNGDGISFQVSGHVTVEDCLCENNAGLGLHPGSGSQHPTVCRNRSRGNGQDGLFVCWRVRHGRFEDNEIRDNRRAGVSIGHKDSDNLFRHNTIIGNAGPGVLFREESEPMGAHRNVFEGNRILDNGVANSGRQPAAGVLICGRHDDLVFRGNTIGMSSPGSPCAGIVVAGQAERLQAAENQFVNVQTAVQSGNR
jgi:hypothetical protein